MPRLAVVDDETCPVPDAMLGQLYRASPNGLAVLVDTIPPAVRGLLALYCYRKSHLASLALTVAATCEEYDLVNPGGPAGAALYQKSRETLKSIVPDPHIGGRRKITLASGQLLSMVPVDDELDDDLEVADLTAAEIVIGAEAAAIPAVA